ncbi:MAG: aminopeptidase [Kofleriaceae bacterium]|nr:aminopeptidase [Kofleriaceae bacterium]
MLQRVSIAILVLVLATSCMQTRYVIQAGLGQAELWSLARDVDDVIADPSTDERTRILLEETKIIMNFAQKNGFDSKGNYEQYVELNRGQVVWFLAAAKPLAFEAEIWNFPLVGSFPYLGWFDRREAMQIRRRLKKRGLDVYMRPVNAYSTGGWLDDPILSSMLSPHDDAFRYLSNILLHELTHANLLVNDQATFNESVASFVGDTMAEEYLIWRFGAESEEVSIYREEAARSLVRGTRFVQAHDELAKLYESKKSDKEKLAKKESITVALQQELGLSWRPNNASLLGFKVYNTGQKEFANLYKACGNSWAPFFKVILELKASDFGEEQLEEIDPVIQKMAPRCQALIKSS